MRLLRLIVASIALVAATPASAQLWLWSQTPATNANVDPSVNWAEGMPPSAVNDTSRAEMSIIAKWRDDNAGLPATTGTSTAYVLTTQSGNNGGLNTSLIAGYHTCFTVNVVNGTPATIAIDGQSAKPVRRAPNTALNGGEMQVGTPYCVTYFTSNGGEYIVNSYFNAAVIPSNSVTYAQIQNVVNNNVVLGNILGANHTVQELTQTQLTALVNTFTSGLNGSVPASGGGTSNFLRSDGSWVAPAGAGPGGTNSQIQYNNSGSFGGFTMSGDATLVVGSGVITIAANAVTYGKLQLVAANNVFLGNRVAINTSAQEITMTQATAMLNQFSSGLQGLVPGSGGGSTNFLRADGNWVAPTGTNCPGSATNTQILYNNAGVCGSFAMSGDATLVTSTGVITIGSAKVTYSKIQNVSSQRLLGNGTGGSAAPSEISLGTGLQWLNTTTIGTNLSAAVIAPNFTTLTSGSGATYNVPTSGGNNPLYLHVKMCGGGGGGGAAVTNGGNNGNQTSFSSTTANGGNGGAAAGGARGSGGSGGTDGSTTVSRIAGSDGGGGDTNSGLGYSMAGGSGGASPFGGNGAGIQQADGSAAKTNSCSGGGGGSQSAGQGGNGGGSGEYVDFYITSPSGSYTYTVGTGGSGGAAGSHAGGNGADGRIEVIAHWQ